MAVIVFDLDMTVIDSSHRHASNADGSVDLSHWFENATRDKVMADKLLPLARSVRTLYDAGHTIVLCTARCMQAQDHEFLAAYANELPHHALFSREGRMVTADSEEYADSYFGFIGDGRNDGVIKLEQITAYIKTLGFDTFEDANVVLFEDNLNTIDLFMKHHAICYNAITCNAKMKAA